MSDTWITLGMGALTLLALGGLVMSHLPHPWNGVGGWLFVSWVAIPGFVLLVELLVRHPALLAVLFLASGLQLYAA